MTRSRASLLPNRVEASPHDTHLSQHGEVMAVLHDQGDSIGPILVATRRQADSGIMVLSSACKLLYANKAARHFLRRLNRRENGHSTDGAFPVSVADILDEMLKSLTSGTSIPDRGQLEARRVLVERDQAVLLQAFGIPDRLKGERSRVVLTIQESTRTLET
jgi:hypothetical protein